MAGTKSSGGRNAKSKTTHLLQGTFRKDRHAKRETPDPPKGRPPRPKGLNGHAAAEWARMVARLDLAGTLSTVDDAALYQYCCLFAETEGLLSAKRANAVLVKRLLSTIDRLVEAAATDRDGLQEVVLDVTEAVAQIVALTAVDAKLTTQLRQGHMAVRQYLVEFGMTPAARSRVTHSGDEPVANPLERFIKTRA